jgi:hypothetical protein
MMYRRFKFDEGTPATLAKLATLHVESGQTVATVATVATPSAPNLHFKPLSSADEAEIEERKGMAAGRVSETYLDGWARLQCQRPASVSDDEWRQAVNDAGLFLDQFGSQAAELQWTSHDLFAALTDSARSGLVWFLKGEKVRALGPEHAITEGGRVFDPQAESSRWKIPFPS